jgi:hypothetical protein
MDCIEKNDEHITGAANLMYNPYKAEYEDEINEWFEKMQLLGKVVEEWGLKFQGK